MDNSIFRQVGRNIQKILSEQGKTQQYLAEQLGISKQVMSKITSGAKAINVAEIKKIADILNVSVDNLLQIPENQVIVHNFSFKGQVKNEATKKKIETLQTVIGELLLLEEYADEKETAK